MPICLSPYRVSFTFVNEFTITCLVFRRGLLASVSSRYITKFSELVCSVRLMSELLFCYVITDLISDLELSLIRTALSVGESFNKQI